MITGRENAYIKRNKDIVKINYMQHSIKYIAFSPLNCKDDFIISRTLTS